jgi:hypothetical protein
MPPPRRLAVTKTEKKAEKDKEALDGKKPRARYDRRTYDALLAGFRDDPGNITKCAKYAGVTREMARGAWHRGFPRQYAAGAAWARPIKEVLAEERDSAQVARAERARKDAEAADAERERARRESIEELAEEGRLRSTTRKAVLGLVLVQTELIPAARACVGVIRSAVLEPDGAGGWKPKAKPDLTPTQASKILREATTNVERLAAGAQRVVELGRLIRGESTLNVAAARDQSPEEALEELEMAAEVLSHVRAARLRQESSAAAPALEAEYEVQEDGSGGAPDADEESEDHA